jgi:hypothetical protein
MRAICDRKKVHQVVLNLLSNTVKFSAASNCVTVHYGYDRTTAFIRVVDTPDAASPPRRLIVSSSRLSKSIPASRGRPAAQGSGWPSAAHWRAAWAAM